MSSPFTIPALLPEDLARPLFMQRCLQLAALGAGYTAPNPLVGAVLVHDGRIIGEGFHEVYGGPHAEVNCLHSVKEADRPLIPFSTLYVSLEPCCHFGKTPPCTERILREKIPHVVVGCRDPFKEVDGKGIEILTAAGVKLDYPVLEDSCKIMNRRFFTFHRQKRPYIILKWAETANHRIAGKNGQRMAISNDHSNRLVHQWRSQEAGILIGTHTALRDDPELNVRFWKGKNPVRIVIDNELRLPQTLHIFDQTILTLVLNRIQEKPAGNIIFKKINSEKSSVNSLLDALHAAHILSVLVEGGARTLQTFLDAGVWDEMRIITNQEADCPGGLAGPDFDQAELINQEIYGSDTIRYYRNLCV